MKDRVLSKKQAWIAIAVLLILDFAIDYEGGGAGHPIWQPVMDVLGIDTVYYLAPLILAAVWLMAKAGAFIERKAEKIGKSEELVLTMIALVYGLYDILLFFANFTAFDMVTDGRYYYLVPLVVAAVAYSWWAEKALKK